MLSVTFFIQVILEVINPASVIDAYVDGSFCGRYRRDPPIICPQPCDPFEMEVETVEIACSKAKVGTEIRLELINRDAFVAEVSIMGSGLQNTKRKLIRKSENIEVFTSPLLFL